MPSVIFYLRFHRYNMLVRFGSGLSGSLLGSSGRSSLGFSLRIFQSRKDWMALGHFFTIGNLIINYKLLAECNL